MRLVARRTGQVSGGLFLVLGIFWTGRESTHGLTAFWEHWWCPIPLALTLLGLVMVITTRRSSSPA
ncbi:MAG TPA: hypothetical protein VN695_12035 [Streptosporangiaceae bacterium]|nr:hypothetical protein [Streptosporangiaceae bacterium]